MPKYRVGFVNTGELIDALENEMRVPEQESLTLPEAPADDKPLIIEQPGPLGRTRVTVVWDKFSDISPEVRQQIVQAAYDRSKGRDTLSERLTPNPIFPIGLTREEWKGVRIASFL